MNVKIRKLMAILDAETACYREMQRVLTEEQTSISFSSNERFDDVQSEKESLVVDLKKLEEKRKTLVGQLSAGYATEGQSMTISQLAHFVEPPIRSKLLARAGVLRSIIGDVQAKNRHNQRMINQSLDLIKGSLKLLTRLMEDSAVYQKPGTHKSAVGYQIGGGRLIRGTA